MVIPYERLAPDTLRQIAGEFVSREGTDYGHTEQSFDTKVDQLLALIKSGKALVLFDSARESLNIVNADDYADNYTDSCADSSLDGTDKVRGL